MLAQQLAPLATGRTTSLFAEDLAARRQDIQSCLCGRRVLVIGGAGSIGAASIREIVRFSPATLHVVDHNENALAELVRDLRSRPERFALADFRALPLDFGSEIMRRFLAEQAPYHCVLNFAALKHVRSEKDTYSALQMLDTNVLKGARLLQWLAAKGGTSAYFCVSTDKAANPVNIMGATKRAMEHVIFSGEAAPDFSGKTSSARFANVAFSDGSLLQSWLYRLEKRQPMAVPVNTKRFFVSLEEAGQICLLASACGAHRHLLVPRMHPQSELHDLQAIAEAFLRRNGFEPQLYGQEEEAKANLSSDVARRRYPLLLTPLNTAGEKPFEEFVADGEATAEVGLAALLAVPYRPAATGATSAFLQAASAYVSHPNTAVTKAALVELVRALVPELRHAESRATLDDRM
jgi:FlaA1/EpsC-like NDP-sugar epimerase